MHDEAKLERAPAVALCICAKGLVPSVLLTKSPKLMRKMRLHWNWLLQPLIALLSEGSSGDSRKEAHPHH